MATGFEIRNVFAYTSFVVAMQLCAIVLLGAIGFSVFEGEKCEEVPARGLLFGRGNPTKVCHRALEPLDAVYMTVITMTTIGNHMQTLAMHAA
jgi:hypothetical protein